MSTMFSRSGSSDGANYETQTVEVGGAARTFKFALALKDVDGSRFDVLHAHTDDYWLWRVPVRLHVRTLHGSCFDEALHIQGTWRTPATLLPGLSEMAATAAADETVAVSRTSRRWTPWVRRVIPNGSTCSGFTPVFESPILRSCLSGRTGDGSAEGFSWRSLSSNFDGSYHRHSCGW